MKQLLILFCSLSLFAADPVINGFFIQPGISYGGIDYDGSTFATQDQFDQWVKTMADVGAEMLFYQWSAHYWGNQDWYSSAYGTPAAASYAHYHIADTTIDGIPTQNWVEPTTWPGSDIPAIEKALNACETNGVKLWLGLYLNEDSDSYNWWNAVNNSDITSADSSIMKHHIDMCSFMVDDLYRQFGSHPAFGGFYYPVEVANLCFYPQQNWDELAWVLDEVADRVHANDPTIELAISPFFNSAGAIEGNGLGSPQEYGAMWNYALANSDLDILILQDGVGVDPFILTDSSDMITPYYEAAKAACDANGVRFWANSELATNTGDRANPSFIPSTMERVERQLKTENPLAEKSVCFSFQYMDPNPKHALLSEDPVTGPTDRLELYNAYKSYLDTVTLDAVSTELAPLTEKSAFTTIAGNSIVLEGNSPVELTLFTFSGRQILERQFNTGATVSLEQLSPGIYLYRAMSGSSVQKGSFLVQ